MAIVCGMDVHGRQIAFDCLDTESGEVFRGVIRPATRERLRRWLQRFHGQEAAFALEATTGWRFVVEELQAAGLEAHLAEPAHTRALRGPKRRAKTDREDARHLRKLLQDGRLPESWIPPTPGIAVPSAVQLGRLPQRHGPGDPEPFGQHRQVLISALRRYGRTLSRGGFRDEGVGDVALTRSETFCIGEALERLALLAPPTETAAGGILSPRPLRQRRLCQPGRGGGADRGRGSEIDDDESLRYARVTRLGGAAWQ